MDEELRDLLGNVPKPTLLDSLPVKVRHATQKTLFSCTFFNCTFNLFVVTVVDVWKLCVAVKSVVVPFY